MVQFLFDRIENNVEKGENAGYHHFLYFLQCFQKASSSGVVKTQDCPDKITCNINNKLVIQNVNQIWNEADAIFSQKGQGQGQFGDGRSRSASCTTTGGMGA